MLTSGRTKKKVVGDDTEAPKAPRLRRRVLHGCPQPQWGKSSPSPPTPVTRALMLTRSGGSHSFTGHPRGG